MCDFIHFTKHDIDSHTDRMREAMINLKLEDKFFQSIALKINVKDQVQYKAGFKLLKNQLKAFLGELESSHVIKRITFMKQIVMLKSKTTLLLRFV